MTEEKKSVDYQTHSIKGRNHNDVDRQLVEFLTNHSGEGWEHFKTVDNFGLSRTVYLRKVVVEEVVKPKTTEAPKKQSTAKSKTTEVKSNE